MYKHHPTIVLGFHACEKEIGEEILSGIKGFKASENEFDWLGHGMYFWENNERRAVTYGQELQEKRGQLEDPMVIGAVINLGYCFDLLDAHSLEILAQSYHGLKTLTELVDNGELPVNSEAFPGDIDLLKRHLDCAVIQFMHSKMKANKEKEFDTVRGVFWEGKEIYPTSGFKEKNHIQICVRNPNCIKGFFRPRELNKKFSRV
ncbi:MAG: hypothetical protein Alis2KO_42080 [Aliiglaciecola sp.]